ncbi:hypothetical protein H5410_060824 [Solanum commersonii]|uniref:Uncharacterized protein n=1 Tax=Solanum commersonii TaxID=4109 RepID=A0A9J5W6B0_SOLCO|nr:hypothetical protein H5410_060824 [Solanum commersonii]
MNEMREEMRYFLVLSQNNPGQNILHSSSSTHDSASSKGILPGFFNSMLVLVSSIVCYGFVRVEFPLYPSLDRCDRYPDLQDPSLE